MESKAQQFIIFDKEARKQQLHSYQKTDHSGLKCGLDIIDKYIRLDKGQLTVMTGKSNVGKSTFTTFYTYLMNKQNNFKTLFFAFEDSIQFYENELLKMYNDEDKMIDNNFFVETEKIKTIEDIETAIIEANTVVTIDTLIIDPFSYIPRPDNYNSNVVGDMLIYLKRLAQNIILSSY